MAKPCGMGIDWAGDGWVGVRFDDRESAMCLHEPQLEPLLADVDFALVDIPIGLPEDDGTLADRERVDAAARSYTGRPSSVFPVPSRTAARAALEGEPYERVGARNESTIGKGLSRQSYHIAAAVGEADELVRSTRVATGAIIEAHPEVCFRAFHEEPLQASKLTAAGVGERLTALDGELSAPGAQLEQLVRSLVGSETTAAIDDVMDALALAVTARPGREALECLPAGTVPTDNEGVPMRMAYREAA